MKTTGSDKAKSLFGGAREGASAKVPFAVGQRLRGIWTPPQYMPDTVAVPASRIRG
jgi:hypothetical protein